MLVKVQDGVTLSCKTAGASIGYRIIKNNADEQSLMHEVQSWDGGVLFSNSKNGQKKASPPVWYVYNGEVLNVRSDELLIVNAMRIGYKAAVVKYSNGNTTITGN